MSSSLLFAPGLQSTPLYKPALSAGTSQSGAVLALLAHGQGEQKSSGTSLCLQLGSLTGCGTQIKSQRADGWGGGIVGREEVEPILSFPYLSLCLLLFITCDCKPTGIS